MTYEHILVHRDRIESTQRARDVSASRMTYPFRSPGRQIRFRRLVEENFSMRSVTSSFVGAVLLVANTGAIAQTYYDDQACRQYADAQTAPLRNQANSQAVGSTLLGAGLGAALGGAIGGGRGAGIGAASGAIVGGGAGIANAQNAGAYLQQQYNAYYSQCMAARTSPPPAYNAPPSTYAPATGYAQPPAYTPSPGYGQPPTYPPNTGYTQPPAYTSYPGYTLPR